MKNYLTLGIFAHANAGKTSLTENLLYSNNQIKQVGRVDNGDTITDDLSVEKNRGITVRSSLVSIDVGDNIIQIIDTPGHIDFSGEVERAMNVLDFAILVVSAVEGVESQTYAIWKELRKNNVPTIIYINKIDRKNADYGRTLRDIREKLTPNCYSCIDNDYKFLTTESLIENFALVDEELFEQYIEKGELSESVLIASIMNSFNNAKSFPVFGGSALKGIGIEPLYQFLANPIQNHILTSNELGAYVYMLRVNDGQIDSYIKLLSGEIKNYGDLIIDGEKNKILNLRTAVGASYVPIEKAVPGQIVVLNGLNCLTGTSLGVANMKKSQFAQPLINMQIKPINQEDVAKLVEVIKILNLEDPHYEGFFDEYTKEIKINLMGEVQAQVLSELIETRFGIKNEIIKPSIIYKETPTTHAKAKSSYTSVSQIELEVTPLERGSGLVIDSKYSTSFLHVKYQNQAKRLIEQYCKQGMFGWNVTDAEISIIGGKFDSMGSDPQHFNICVPLALFRALQMSNMRTLEPMIEFYIDSPSQYGNKILNSLYSKKAKITRFDNIGDTTLIVGIVPFSEMISFPIELNKITSGLGTYTYEFSQYKFSEEDQIFERRYGPDPRNEVKFVISDMQASLASLDNEGTGKKPRRSKFAREQMERAIAIEKKNATKRTHIPDDKQKGM